MDKELILANLHLHAVLPRLEELVIHDSEARQLAADMDVTLRFWVREGPSVQIAFTGGRVRAYRDNSVRTDVGLGFVSCAQLNKMFLGGKVIPIPYWGVWNLNALKKFTRLTEILPRYLKPSAEDMNDPAFKARATEMMMMVGLSAVRVLGDLDPKAKKAAAKLKNGTVLFKVLPNGPQAHILVDRGRIFAFNGPVTNPTTTVEFKNLEIASGLLSGKLDGFAALGLGDLRMSGLLTMADEINSILDRVGLYLS